MSDRLLQLRRAATLAVVQDVTFRRALAVTGFAVLTALAARAAVPLPGTAVPVTLQTLVVSLSGALLGARLGALSQALYLAAGAVGLPVFAAGGGILYLLGPTGGYLLAYPVAAWVTGMLAPAAGRTRSASGQARLAGAILLGTLVVLAGGAAQLTLLLGDPARAIAVGVVPFLLGDLVKVLLATAVAGRLRDRTLGLLS